jgi:hypothetical protein
MTGDRANIDSINQDLARSHLVEAHDQLEDRRLPTTRLAHEGHLCARFNHERDAIEDTLAPRGVGESYVPEFYFTSREFSNGYLLIYFLYLRK